MEIWIQDRKAIVLAIVGKGIGIDGTIEAYYIICMLR